MIQRPKDGKCACFDMIANLWSGGSVSVGTTNSTELESGEVSNSNCTSRLHLKGIIVMDFEG